MFSINISNRMKPVSVFFKATIIFSWSVLMAISACKPNPTKHTQSFNTTLQPDTSIRYAKGFSIQTCATYTLLTLSGTPKDSSNRYLLYNDSLPTVFPHANCIPLKVPVRSIAALSCIYVSMLDALGSMDAVSATDNADYSNNSNLLKGVSTQKIIELAKGPELDLEKTIALNPQLVLTFGMVNERPSYKSWLDKRHIPLVICYDHLEKSALARSEWMKCLALFTGKRQQADSLFTHIEKEYQRIAQLAQKTTLRPSVFCELKYGDVWYMPAGKSSVAQLIKDAGANYLWANDTASGSLNLSFESVYQKANQAQFWINTSSVASLNEIIAQDKRYQSFRAFQNQNVYHYCQHVNTKGYSSYWETGMLYPNQVLNDLTLIFHPELKDSLNAFYFYKQLK